MTIAIPSDLLSEVVEYAEWRRMSVDCVVREALVDWIKSEKEIKAELDLWQEVRTEALDLVERSLD